jgi:ectoine hydroxylase
LREQLPVVYGQDSPGRVFEAGTNVVRAVHGVHVTNEVFARLIRYSPILKPAMQILGSQVYVHQFKVTAKPAFVGDVWEWHQDTRYWINKDGLPTERCLNIVLFLSEVNEFNGPLMLIPGTHQIGVIGSKSSNGDSNNRQINWGSHMTSKLPDTIDAETLEHYVRKSGIVAPKGPAGCILFFHPSAFHGSVPNLSPFNRELLLVSYNSVENRPEVDSPRPDFLAGKDYRPLMPLEQDKLVV